MKKNRLKNMVKAIIKHVVPNNIWDFTRDLVHNVRTGIWPSKIYRILFFDDCPKWQDLWPRTQYRIREWKNRKNLPSISPVDKKIVKDIEQEGVHLSSLDLLGFENTKTFKELSNNLFEDTARLFPDPPSHLGGHFAHEKHTLRPPFEYIIEKYPQIIQFALNSRLLSIVQHYIGAPAALLDVDFKIDLPGGNDAGSKIWHYDRMDYKILKIFIYFSDVTKTSPAFEYIPAKECFGIRHERFNEAKVYELTKKENIKRVEAPAESVLFIGVDRILHHLSIPDGGEDRGTRKAIVLHYLSKDVPAQCLGIRNGSVPRWGTPKVIKMLNEFSQTLPEDVRKYVYIHS